MKRDEFFTELEKRGWEKSSINDPFFRKVEGISKSFESGFFNDGCVVTVFNFAPNSYILKYEKFSSYACPKREHQIFIETIEEFLVLLKVLGYDRGL